MTVESPKTTLLPLKSPADNTVVDIAPEEGSDTSKWRAGVFRRQDSPSHRRGSKFKSMSIIANLRERTEYAIDRWEKEKLILKANYKLLLVCITFQYVHSVCTNIVYYLHVPRQPLYDLGFAVLPALSKQMQILSEIMFFILFFSTIMFMLSPLVSRRRSQLFATTILTRFFGVCAVAQFLRCVTFLVTVLPGPNYHCRPNSPDYSPPQSIGDIFLRQDAFYGCGDLLFSSHTIFVLLCALTYTKYSDSYWLKRCIWVLVFFFGLLVVSARKHYSVDIIVAWYTVPLIWIACEKHFPDRLPQELLDILVKEQTIADDPAKKVKDLV